MTRYGTDANYYIETKQPDVYPGMEQQLLDTLNRHNMLTSNSLENGHVLVQSFSEASLLKNASIKFKCAINTPIG